MLRSACTTFVALSLLCAPLAVAVPGVLRHSGYVLSASDAPLDGTVAMTFELFDAATGGTSKWLGAASVEVRGGYYAVDLGTSPAFPADVWDGPRWLETTIESTVLAPRVALGSVGRAELATRALDLGCTGCVESAEIAGLHGGKLETGTVPWTALAALPASGVTVANLGATHGHTASQISGALDPSQLPANLGATHGHDGAQITGTIGTAQLPSTVVRTDVAATLTQPLTLNPSAGNALQFGASGAHFGLTTGAGMLDWKAPAGSAANVKIEADTSNAQLRLFKTGAENSLQYIVANEFGGDYVNTGVLHLHNNAVAGTGLVVDKANRVGVGTLTPKAALDVAGGMKLANDGEACAGNPAKEGTIRYNASAHALEFCNGTDWATVGTGTGFGDTTLGTLANPGKHCRDIRTRNGNASADALYWVDPDGAGTGNSPFQAWCDMNTDTGGWTLVLRTWYVGGSTPCPGVANCQALRTTAAVNTPALAARNTLQNGKYSDAVINLLRDAGEYRWGNETSVKPNVFTYFPSATWVAPSSSTGVMFTSAWFAYPRSGGGHAWAHLGSTSHGGWDGPDYGDGGFMAAGGQGWFAAGSQAHVGAGAYWAAHSDGTCYYAAPPSPCKDFGLSIWVR